MSGQSPYKQIPTNAKRLTEFASRRRSLRNMSEPSQKVKNAIQRQIEAKKRLDKDLISNK